MNNVDKTLVSIYRRCNNAIATNTMGEAGIRVTAYMDRADCPRPSLGRMQAPEKSYANDS